MKFSILQQAIDYIDACNKDGDSCTLEEFDDVFAPDGVILRQTLELFCGLHVDEETNLLTFRKVCRRNPSANYPEDLSGKPSVKSSVVSLPAISMSGMSMSASGAINIT